MGKGPVMDEELRKVEKTRSAMKGRRAAAEFVARPGFRYSNYDLYSSLERYWQIIV
jgi:hypothetical protein